MEEDGRQEKDAKRVQWLDTVVTPLSRHACHGIRFHHVPVFVLMEFGPGNVANGNQLSPERRPSFYPLFLDFRYEQAFQ